MIFDRITLINVQSHKETKLELHEHVNCIVGETDQGKSSVIRALHFFHTNTFRKSYLRWGEKNLNIIIEGNGYKITRTKGAENSFTVEKNGQVETYNAVGSGAIPQEIQDILKFNPEMPFNIARQTPLDLDFLMTNTGSERSSHLSVILKLDKIEGAIKDVSTDIYKAARRSRKICLDKKGRRHYKFQQEKRKRHRPDVG